MTARDAIRSYFAPLRHWRWLVIVAIAAGAIALAAGGEYALACTLALVSLVCAVFSVLPRPRSAESVARELIDGLEDGSITVNREELQE